MYGCHSYLILFLLCTASFWSQSFTFRQILSKRSLKALKEPSFCTFQVSAHKEENLLQDAVSHQSPTNVKSRVDIPMLVNFMKKGLRRKFVQLLPPITITDFSAILKHTMKFSNSLSLSDLSNVIWTLGYLKVYRLSVVHYLVLQNINKNIINRFKSELSKKSSRRQVGDVVKFYIGIGKIGVKWSNICADASFREDYLFVLSKILHSQDSVKISNIFHSLGMIGVPFYTLPADIQNLLMGRGMTVLRTGNTRMIGAILTSLCRMQLNRSTLPKGLINVVFDAIKDTAFLFDGASLVTILSALGKLGIRAEELPVQMIVAIELAIRKAKGRYIDSDISLVLHGLQLMHYKWSMLTIHTQLFLADEIFYYICHAIRMPQKDKQLSIETAYMIIYSLANLKASWYELPENARLGLAIALSHLLDRQEINPEKNTKDLTQNLLVHSHYDGSKTIATNTTSMKVASPMSEIIRMLELEVNESMISLLHKPQSIEKNPNLKNAINSALKTKFRKSEAMDWKNHTVNSTNFSKISNTTKENATKHVKVLSNYRALCSLPSVEKENATSIEQTDDYYFDQGENDIEEMKKSSLGDMTDIFQHDPQSQKNDSLLDIRPPVEFAQVIDSQEQLQQSRGTVEEELYKLQQFYKNVSSIEIDLKDKHLVSDSSTSEEVKMKQNKAQGYVNILYALTLLYTNPESIPAGTERISEHSNSHTKQIPANIKRVLFTSIWKYRNYFTLQGISKILLIFGKFQCPWQHVPWTIKTIIIDYSRKSFKQVTKEIKINARNRATFESTTVHTTKLPASGIQAANNTLSIQPNIINVPPPNVTISSIPALQTFISVIHSLIHMGYNIGNREAFIADHRMSASNNFNFQLMHWIEHVFLNAFPLQDTISLLNTLVSSTRTDRKSNFLPDLVNENQTKRDRLKSTFTKTTHIGRFSFTPSFKKNFLNQVMKQLHGALQDPAKYTQFPRDSIASSAVIVQVIRVLYALEFTAKDLLMYRHSPSVKTSSSLPTGTMNKVLMKALVMESSKLPVHKLVEVFKYLGMWEINASLRVRDLLQIALSRPTNEYSLFSVAKLLNSLSRMPYIVEAISYPLDPSPNKVLIETIGERLVHIQAEAIRHFVDAHRQRNDYVEEHSSDTAKHIFSGTQLKLFMRGCASLQMTWMEFPLSMQEGLLYLIKYYLPLNKNVRVYLSVITSLRHLVAFPPTGLLIVDDKEAKKYRRKVQYPSERRVSAAEFDILEQQYLDLRKRLIREYSPIFESFVAKHIPTTPNERILFEFLTKSWNAFRTSVAV